MALRESFLARRGLLTFMFAGLLWPVAASATEVYLCQVSCLCISWDAGGGSYFEVRCDEGGSVPAGWATGPGSAGDGSGGSWLGTGTAGSAPSPLPGMALSGATNMAVQSARSTAITKLRGEKVPDMKGVWESTQCTRLFTGNPLGEPGAQILGSYVIFRDGTGVRNENNVDVCATGNVSVWTKCCQHDPVVFVCPSQFIGLSPSQRITKLIHETLHVAGQFENTNGGVGPGDPPNPSQIDAVVDEACN